MKSFICEVCAALFSPETAYELEYSCINGDGKLIEIEVDEAKMGHIVDKEMRQIRRLKKSYAFDYREGYDGCSIL